MSGIFKARLKRRVKNSAKAPAAALEIMQSAPRRNSGSASIVGAKRLNRLTEIVARPYSGGMISEFQDLSDKIDRLAALSSALRSENALLRQSNALLSAENEAYMGRLSEAQRRVEALLASLPGELAPQPDEAKAMP